MIRKLTRTKSNRYPKISFSEAIERLTNTPLSSLSDYTTLISSLGSISPDYFQNKYEGGLELQQIPEELDQLSRALIKRSRGKKIDYLEVGAGSCATLIFLSHLFEKNDIDASLYAIDNLNHYNTGLLENQKTRIKWCQENIGLSFYNMDTAKTEFTGWLKNRLFDVILVDGDHSFEGCLWDFTQCVKSLKRDGWIILHDITSDACPGVREVFELNKNVFKKSYVYSSSNTCGIGVLEGLPEYIELINNTFYYSIQKNKILSEQIRESSKQPAYSGVLTKWFKDQSRKLKRSLKL